MHMSRRILSQLTMKVIEWSVASAPLPKTLFYITTQTLPHLIFSSYQPHTVMIRFASKCFKDRKRSRMLDGRSKGKHFR